MSREEGGIRSMGEQVEERDLGVRRSREEREAEEFGSMGEHNESRKEENWMK